MGRIVLIEHDEEFGQLFVALLTHASHDVEVVGSPREFSFLASDPSRDLVIMSEDDDWREVQSLLPALAPGAGMLLMTGAIVGGSRPPGFLCPDYPGCRVLPKPFGYQELCTAVDRSLQARIIACP